MSLSDYADEVNHNRQMQKAHNDYERLYYEHYCEVCERVTAHSRETGNCKVCLFNERSDDYEPRN